MGKSRGARGSTVIEPRKGYGGGYGRGAGADKNGNYGFGSTRQRGRSSSATPRPGGAVPPNKPASSQGPKEQPGDQEKPPTEERRRVDATPVSSRSQVQPAQPAQPVQQARVDEPSDGPPKPDRAAHDEALAVVDKAIGELEARQRQLQENFIDPKEFDEKKAQLRAKLDTTSREIQQIQECKERLLSQGVWHSHEQEKEMQEDEERRQVITELNVEIEELEEQMWVEQLSLAEEKQILMRVAALRSERTALLNQEKEQEAARKDRDQNVKVQAEQLTKQIRELRSRKKAIAQEYQELMGQMQEQDAVHTPRFHNEKLAIMRRLEKKRQERSRMESEFKQQERTYSTWSRSKSRGKAAPAPAEGRVGAARGGPGPARAGRGGRSPVRGAGERAPPAPGQGAAGGAGAGERRRHHQVLQRAPDEEAGQASGPPGEGTHLPGSSRL